MVQFVDVLVRGAAIPTPRPRASLLDRWHAGLGHHHDEELRDLPYKCRTYHKARNEEQPFCPTLTFGVSFFVFDGRRGASRHGH